MAATERKHATIVLVEDDVTLGNAFARVLRSGGYEVWLTGTADDGLEKVKVVRPDVVICDFRMPLVNGLGFLYRLRAAEGDHRTPVVVVTGDTSLADDVKAQLQELGAELRFKPIMPNDLLEAARRLIDEPTTSDTPQRTVW